MAILVGEIYDKGAELDELECGEGEELLVGLLEIRLAEVGLEVDVPHLETEEVEDLVDVEVGEVLVLGDDELVPDLARLASAVLGVISGEEVDHELETEGGDLDELDEIKDSGPVALFLVEKLEVRGSELEEHLTHILEHEILSDYVLRDLDESELLADVIGFCLVSEFEGKH